MQTIDLTAANLNEEDMKIAEQIVKRNGQLYASKPKKASGEAQYVWRMVVFMVSNKPAHQCIPVTAEFDLPDKYWNGENAHELRRARTKELDKLADAIIDTVPKHQWHGVMRWGHALGSF